MSNRDGEKKGEKVEQEVNQQTEMTAGEQPVEHDAQKAALEAVEVAQKEILYIRAEFENYKKRIQREQEQAIKFANKGIILELLNLVDLFDRAIIHAKPLKEKNDKDVNNFVNGIEMTRHELSGLMQRSGVELIGSVNDKFDPSLHEAVTQIPSANGADGEETVVEVVQKGCKLNGKLIKPARVVVGQK